MITIDDKEYSKESVEKWCAENHLPENFFLLSVQERRDAFKECQRKLWEIKGNDRYFEIVEEKLRKEKLKETKEHEFTIDVSLPYESAPRSFEDSMRSIAKITARSHRETLQKSKYDIDFIIRVLKDQLIVIERERLRPSSLALTMSHSIKSLLSFLEVEKSNGN